MGFDFLDFGFPKSGTDWKSLNGKPNVTISNKGRSNQKSNKINDGCDFGPDTTLGATSPNQTGPPYSKTLGINEMLAYFVANGGGHAIMKNGIYDVTNAPFVNISANVSNPYFWAQIYVPSINDNDNLIPIVVEGESMAGGYSYSGYGANTNGVIIQSLANPGNVNYAIWMNETQVGGPANLSMNWIRLNNITFRTQQGATLSGLRHDYDFKVADGFLSFDINTSLPIDQITPSDLNQGIAYGFCTSSGAANPQYAEYLHIVGYYSAVGMQSHSAIGKLDVYNCYYMVNTGNVPYAMHITAADVQNTIYVIACSNASATININSLLLGDDMGVASGTSPMQMQYLVYDPSNALHGQITVFPDFNVAPFTLDNFISGGSNFRINSPSRDRIQLVPTTPAVPASGTAQQNVKPYPVNVYLYGGTVTEIQITKNGIANTVFSNASGLALSGQVYKLNPSDSITITYTTAPSWMWLSD